MTVSCELSKETASRFKEYCRDMHIEYEPSECYNNIHFVLYNVTQEQVDKANKFIDERC